MSEKTSYRAFLVDTATEGELRIECRKLDQKLSAAGERIRHLEAQNKRLLIDNLDYAITLAETDPLFAEDLRPYFRRVYEALL